MGPYKTKICRTWENEGSCNYSGCKFAHGKQELCFPKDDNGYVKSREHSYNVPRSNHKIYSRHSSFKQKYDDRKAPSLDNHNYKKRKYDHHGHYDNNGSIQALGVHQDSSSRHYQCAKSSELIYSKRSKYEEKCNEESINVHTIEQKSTIQNEECGYFTRNG
ncbi:hypothetical protein M758_5G162400 [Ceratodon purpureus]|nr:hypothetical protein M758_5G162400 [Ceratodon purpureus]